MLQLNEQEPTIIEMTAKIGGVILKKAELENNFEAVYSKVFERIFELHAVGGEEFLIVLGEVGG